MFWKAISTVIVVASAGLMGHSTMPLPARHVPGDVVVSPRQDVIPDYLKRDPRIFQSVPGVSADLESQYEAHRDSLIEQCMAARGINYTTPVERPRVTTWRDHQAFGAAVDSNDVPATRRVYVRPADASTLGYQITEQDIEAERQRRQRVAQEAALAHTSMTFDPKAFPEVLRDEDDSEQPVSDPDFLAGVQKAALESCRRDVENTLFDDVEAFGVTEMKYVNRHHLVIGRARSDEMLRQVEQEYRDCMREAGFPHIKAAGVGAVRALDARVDGDDAAILTERRMATADVACEERTRFLKTLREASDRVRGSESRREQANAEVTQIIDDYSRMLREALNRS